MKFKFLIGFLICTYDIKFIDLFAELSSGSIRKITENASTTLLFLTTSFRMVDFMLRRGRYLDLVEKVDDLYHKMLQMDLDYSKAILKLNVRYVKTLTLLFWTSALITGNMMCISTAFTSLTTEAYEKRNLILNSWFPFDYCKYYWIAYGIQLYIMYVGMLIVPCWHSFIVSVMIIIISKLKILNSQLSKLDCRNDGSDSRDEFIIFIEHRVEIKKLVEDLQALIAPSMFLDFFVFSILLCALLFEASQVEI